MDKRAVVFIVLVAFVVGLVVGRKTTSTPTPEPMTILQALKIVEAEKRRLDSLEPIGTQRAQEAVQRSMQELRKKHPHWFKDSLK